MRTRYNSYSVRVVNGGLDFILFYIFILNLGLEFSIILHITITNYYTLVTGTSHTIICHDRI